MAKQATQAPSVRQRWVYECGRPGCAGTLAPHPMAECPSDANTSRAACERYLAAIVAALPEGMLFLEWYGYPDESIFVGSRAVKRAARSAWDTLQGMGEALDLTVFELLDAEGIDCGPYPDDEPEPSESTLKEDARNFWQEFSETADAVIKATKQPRKRRKARR